MSLLLASLASSQDPNKRNSLLNKRANTRSVFQKSTTTTTEASYDVRLFDLRRLIGALCKINCRKKTTSKVPSWLRKMTIKTMTMSAPQQQPPRRRRELAPSSDHLDPMKICCPPWRSAACRRRTANRQVSAELIDTWESSLLLLFCYLASDSVATFCGWPKPCPHHRPTVSAVNEIPITWSPISPIRVPLKLTSASASHHRLDAVRPANRFRFCCLFFGEWCNALQTGLCTTHDLTNLEWLGARVIIVVASQDFPIPLEAIEICISFHCLIRLHSVNFKIAEKTKLFIFGKRFDGFTWDVVQLIGLSASVTLDDCWAVTKMRNLSLMLSYLTWVWLHSEEYFEAVK